MKRNNSREQRVAQFERAAANRVLGFLGLALIAILTIYSSAAAQSLLWARRAGSGGSSPSLPQDVGQAIALDGAGNAYITGQFRNTATFGPGQPNQTILTAAGAQQEIFVAKYDRDGILQWAKRISTAEGQGTGIGVDGANNVYVTGFFNLSGTFAPGEGNQTILTPFGVKDIFLAKYDTNGNFVWAKQAGSTFSDQAEKIAVDSAGNSYVTGRFGSMATFGSGEANQTVLTASGSSEDAFVAKYNSSGLLQWAKQITSGGGDIGYGIGIDAAGNSYVTGNFSLTATFGAGEVNQTQLSAPLGGSTDFFIAKYNTNGLLQWARRAGQFNNDRGYAVAVDAAGNSYATGVFLGVVIFGEGQPNQTSLTGDFNEDVFIAKYDTNGFLQWAKRAIGGSYDSGQGIAVDGAGNVYLTGFGQGTTFGPGELNETSLGFNGVEDVFVAKFDARGLFRWVKLLGGTGTDKGLGIAVHSSGIYATGQFAGSNVIFGQGEFYQTTLSSAGAADVFVAKFANCRAAVDFDGDCKSDVGIYRDGLWPILGTADGLIVEGLGGSTHTPVPADYDGDGKADIAVYLPANGVWSIKRSSDGVTITTGFGGPAFVPVPADYDGDGKADIAVFSGGVWSILRSSDGGNTVIAHGGPGWTPVPADYDGDGKADAAVYINGARSIKRSSDSVIAVSGHGGPTWTPVPGDYDGDGKTDIAVYTVGAWSIIRSSNGGNTVVGHGGPTWEPVAADYDGDGKTDIAVHLSGAWAIINSTTSSISVVGHGGGPSDVPLN